MGCCRIIGSQVSLALTNRKADSRRRLQVEDICSHIPREGVDEHLRGVALEHKRAIFIEHSHHGGTAWAAVEPQQQRVTIGIVLTTVVGNGYL